MRFLYKNESGIALFFVLWILTLLSVIVAEFCHTMRAEVNITRNFYESTNAYYIARTGINHAIYELLNEEPFCPRFVKKDENKENKDEKIEWRLNVEIPEMPFAQGKYKVVIGNESGKIHLNKAGSQLFTMIVNNFKIAEKEKDIIVDSILDWRESGNFHRLNGAKSDYYMGLPEPYECKNAPFDSIEELLLVKGVSKEIFYGGLKDLVTLYPELEKDNIYKKKDIKKESSNDTKIDLNAALPSILYSLPKMTDKEVNAIIEYRKEKDFQSLNDVAKILKGEVFNTILPYVTLDNSSYYTIQSTGMFNGSNNHEEIFVVIKIDRTLKKNYQILEWRDKRG